MGKKTKIGKQRKDKFYQLAKETGYRSRAAFKLLQLNRKYEFLQRSRVLVDLCAAPGGWLQVASQNMPVSSIIIGIDLVPIKPINNVVTIQEDIRSAKCRQLLRKELQTWKADCILNDGAPNVGKNWLHDAFSQAQLTLSALKLATEVLNKGGWFITKMFRSKDYNAMLWVFQQFFKKVYATKPQASRNESAEIFVVCQHYLAPDKIDPKFLDPRSVFAEIDMEPSAKKLDLGHPEKAKKKPQGYPEGDYTLHHKVPITQFLQGNNHLEMLNSCSELVFDDDIVTNHPLTTSEIKECCKDIKVLGRKEFRILLTWRKNLKKLLYDKKDGDDVAKVEEVENEEDEEEKIQKEIEDLQIEEVKEAKLKKKKVLKERRKLRDKMNLKMVLPNDEPMVSEDLSLFQLAAIQNKKQLQEEEEKELADLDDFLLEGDKDDSKTNLPRYVSYDKNEPIPDDYEDSDGDDSSLSDAKSLGSLESDSNQSDEETEADNNNAQENPLLLDLDYASNEEKNRRRVEMWFGKESFADLEDESDEGEFKGDLLLQRIKAKTLANGIDKPKKETELPSVATPAADLNSKPVNAGDNIASDSDSSDDSDSDDSDYNIDDEINGAGSAQPNNAKMSKKAIHEAKRDGFEIVPHTKLGKRRKVLDPEGLALGSLMIQSKKKKRDILDLAWNRYTNNDENLPNWFVKEEEKHYRRNIPVTKEMVADYRDRLKEINARPVKKVAEAQARKKRRSTKKLDKARKKAEHVVDSLDMTDREKMQQIKAIYKRAGVGAKPKKEVTYVVSKKGLSGKRVSRPTGVKGRFRVVDPRMKKDEMKRKSIEKQVKSKKLPKSKLTRLKTKIANNRRGKATKHAKK